MKSVVAGSLQIKNAVAIDHIIHIPSPRFDAPFFWLLNTRFPQQNDGFFKFASVARNHFAVHHPRLRFFSLNSFNFNCTIIAILLSVFFFPSWGLCLLQPRSRIHRLDISSFLVTVSLSATILLFLVRVFLAAFGFPCFFTDFLFFLFFGALLSYFFFFASSAACFPSFLYFFDKPRRLFVLGFFVSLAPRLLLSSLRLFPSTR